MTKNNYITKNPAMLSAVTKILCFLLAITAAFTMPVYAQTNADIDTSKYYVKTDSDRVWIRAKIEYILDGDTYGIDDNSVVFHDASSWEKDGEWFYYKEPVDSGSRIRLFDSFSIPTGWKNETSGDGFKIVVTAQASEVIPGDSAWNSNSDVCYSTTFDVYSTGDYGLASDEIISEGTIKLKLVEYELDKDGKEVSYQNDKTVIPGQKVSKIVEIQVEGDKGKIWKKIKDLAKQTGDSSNLILWCSGAVIAGGAAVIIYRRRKKA